MFLLRQHCSNESQLWEESTYWLNEFLRCTSLPTDRRPRNLRITCRVIFGNRRRISQVRSKNTLRCVVAVSAGLYTCAVTSWCASHRPMLASIPMQVVTNAQQCPSFHRGDLATFAAGFPIEWRQTQQEWDSLRTQLPGAHRELEQRLRVHFPIARLALLTGLIFEDVQLRASVTIEALCASLPSAVSWRTHF